MAQTAKQIALLQADHASRCAAARLWGMKYRASETPPQAATGSFPYPHRTCAEWLDECSPPVPTPVVRYDSAMDKIKGSARLRDAILGMAA